MLFITGSICLVQTPKKKDSVGKITTEWILETGKSQENLSELNKSIEAFNNSLKNSNEAGKETFRASAKATEDYNRNLSESITIYRKAENSTKAFEAEIKRLTTVYTDLRKNQKSYIAEGRYEELQGKIKQVRNRIQELGGSIEDTGKKSQGLGSVFKNVFAGMTAYFSIGAVVDLGKQIFNVTAEFQKFEAVLTTSLGSGSAAERALLMIQDFAAKTPFSVAELTDSYVKLANRGLRPTTEELTALGDLASSTGKSFDQLTEAVLDAMSGENERLKEFGIQASKVGDKTFYTFKGVTTQVENTGEAIQKYLVSLGQVEGVTGSMASISETLEGQVSNLGDSFDELFRTIGSGNSGVLSGFISGISEAVKSVTNLIASTDQLGKKFASSSVNKYASETKANFSELAATAIKNGQDVEQALSRQSEVLQKDLETKLKTAEANLTKFREERSRFDEFTDLSGRTYLTNKTTETTLASLVQQYKGQIAAIDDVRKEVLKPKPVPVDKNAVKEAEKAAKAAADARKKALADLERELERLEREAAQARLNLLDKNSKEYQVELYAQRTKEIDIMEDSIKRMEKLAGKDGKLDPKQAEQLNILRAQALREYQENIYNIELEQRKKLLDLSKDSDQKELDQIKLRYDTEIQEAQRNKNQALVIALEKARDLELAQTKFRQANANLDSEESLATEVAIAYKVDNTQTDSIKLERDKQQAILDVQIEYAQKRMNLLETETGAEATARRLALANTINDLKASKAEIQKEQQQADFNIMALLGIDEEDRAAVQESLDTIVGSLQDFTAKQLELANENVEQRQEEVEEKQNALNTEIELNKLGFASNVETRRKELEDAKKARAEAIKEQEKAQKRQAQIQSLQQINSLVTAGANIIQGWSSVPLIGSILGIVAVGAMLASFFAFKGKAAASARMEHGGLLGGKRHSQRGNKYISMDGNSTLEHEEGEYFTNRKSTKKYLKWLEAINDDDTKELSNLAFKFLLKDTGVIPAPELPKEIEKKVHVYHQAKTTIYEQGQDQWKNKILQRLDSIESNTGNKDSIQFLPDGTRIEKKGNQTRIVRPNN